MLKHDPTKSRYHSAESSKEGMSLQLCYEACTYSIMEIQFVQLAMDLIQAQNARPWLMKWVLMQIVRIMSYAMIDHCLYSFSINLIQLICMWQVCLDIAIPGKKD